mmetsp:Transcript_2134/g.4928  ORF Transcript_2134/g.4928 Transcript_2134/m.4928 type:complete len:214 (+) Transcript_2134:669-1310(+)
MYRRDGPLALSRSERCVHGSLLPRRQARGHRIVRVDRRRLAGGAPLLQAPADVPRSQRPRLLRHVLAGRQAARLLLFRRDGKALGLRQAGLFGDALRAHCRRDLRGLRPGRLARGHQLHRRHGAALGRCWRLLRAGAARAPGGGLLGGLLLGRRCCAHWLRGRHGPALGRGDGGVPAHAAALARQALRLGALRGLLTGLRRPCARAAAAARAV